VGDLHYLSAFAELAVADVEASAGWYESTLGFHRIATYRFRRGKAVHLRRSEEQEVVLVEAEPGSPSTSGHSRLTLNFAVDTDLAGLSALARRAGAAGAYIPFEGPDEPEALEFADPDGHLLRFFARETPSALSRRF
jgi:catechol 2,3-dioxygenase-like lactoylglutathione lyase family enzyme